MPTIAQKTGAETTGEEIVMLTVRVPESLHTKAKSTAAMRRISLQELVVEALDTHLSKKEITRRG